MRPALVIALAASIAWTGCARRKRPRLVPAAPGAVAVGSTETGVASWYGHPYHGRASASGEIYDMEKLTAAHRTMPFHTWVRVSCLENGKSVEVRINDRGPFVGDRIIDLSKAAARKIDMLGPGTAKVKVEVIRTPQGPAVPRFAIQVGAFRDRGNAERLEREMKRKYGATRLVRHEGTPVMWRVLVGEETTPEAALALGDRIRRDGGPKSDGFVVRLDS